MTHDDYALLYSSFSKRINGNVTPYVLASIQTVVKNEKGHMNRDVAHAKAVLPLIQALGYPSRKDLRKIINAKSIANCPVTVADMDRFYRIYSVVEGAIKGKTVRKTPVEVSVDENKTDIPRELAKELEKVTMSLDIFYVDRIPYLTTISRKLLFTTARALQSRDHDAVMSAIMEVISFYKMHKHEVNPILSDNEFGPLKERIRRDAGAELNLSSPKEHVPEEERNIRLIKERLRSMLAGMPYGKIPTNFKRELILTCASMLNVISREASVSDTLSPMVQWSY